MIGSPLMKAAQEKSKDLEDLVKKSSEILKKYQDSVKEVDVVEKELEIHSQTAEDALARVDQEYIKLVKKTVRSFNEEICKIKEEKNKGTRQEEGHFENQPSKILRR